MHTVILLVAAFITALLSIAVGTIMLLQKTYLLGSAQKALRLAGLFVYIPFGLMMVLLLFYDGRYSSREQIIMQLGFIGIGIGLSLYFEKKR